MTTFKLFLSSMLAMLAIGSAGAGSAQALEAEWMVATETFPTLKVEKESISMNGEITISVPSKKITIVCTGAEGSGTLIKGGTGETTVSISSCKVVELTKCVLAKPIVMSAKFQSILAGGTYYEKIEPLKEGAPLMTVEFKGEMGCVLPLKTEVTGTVAAKISQEELVKQPLQFSETTTNTVNAKLKEEGSAELKLLYGVSPAFLSGELAYTMTGAFSGQQGKQANNTRICDTAPAANRNNCTGVAYPATTAVKTVQVNALKFKYGTAPTVTCPDSKWQGTTTANMGAPLPGKFTVMNFTNCTNAAMPNPENCTVTTTAAAGTPLDFFFETLDRGVGRIVVKQPKFKIVCPTLTCEYGGVSLPFLIAPSPLAELSSVFAYDLPHLAGPAGCGTKVIWEKTGGGAVLYKFEAPLPIHVTG